MTTLKNKRRTAAPKRPLNCVLTTFVVAGFSSAALANPQNSSVVQGNAVVTTNGSELTVTTTGRTILNWDSFSIGSGELTRFVMDSANQAVLNRVMGGTLSQIDGRLESNGRLYLINPNGVIIGATGSVQTQSFIASTRDITNADFMDDGDLTFVGVGSGEVHNLGTIQAADGDVALIGKRVLNTGTITASEGIIALAAGDEVMLAAPGSERLLVRVDGVSTQATLIDHTGVLSAAQAELQAAGGNPYALAVNVGGQIIATGVQNRAGRIYLTTDTGLIDVAGTLTAKNSDGSGGGIHLDSTLGAGSEVNVSGTLDASSTSTGGSINIDSSHITLDDGAQLIVSGGSGNAGGVFIGSQSETDSVHVNEGASIEANSGSGDAGNIDLTGAGVYFHGQLHARGGASQGVFNILSGEAIEYTGLADLRSYDNEPRFGSVNIESLYANLTIAADLSNVIDVDALATQLNYGNVTLAANRTDRSINVNAPISWQSATRLTLQADGDIGVNEAIEASNGSLHLTSLNGDVTALEPASLTARNLWLSAANDVNLTNRVVAQNVTLYDIGGRISLANEQNQLGAITFSRDLRPQSGEVNIVDSADGLTLTTSNVGGIAYSTDGNFLVRTAGDLTLSQAFQTQVGGDITLVAAGGVFRNQSTAGANVFGTSSTGLERTRVYAASAGENGGLEGPAQYNVSYSDGHAETASTGFYYSGSTPQDPGPSDPEEPVDPVDPVDPPPAPEPVPEPPAQIIQTALGGNSFEQLNRPPENFNLPPSVPIVLPSPPPAPTPNSVTLTSAMTDQLQQLAERAAIDSNPTKQPSQQAIDQLDDAMTQMMAFLQGLSAGAGAPTAEQLVQKLGSLPPEITQLMNQSPALFQQQLAIILTQYAVNAQKASLDDRKQAMDQQLDQVLQAAQQMRDLAIQQMTNAIVTIVTQVANTALNAGNDPKTKNPALPKAPEPLPIIPPLVSAPVKKDPQPSSTPPIGYQAPRTAPPPIVVPVAPSLPPALQAQLDAQRQMLQGSPTQTTPPPVVVPLPSRLIPVPPPIPSAVQAKIDAGR
ncbi:filamentous hemagglutinin N-terminal domain-containing protein [Steroidobacter flavus]|uniref:Filamentous hemagglutinin N-terminal domain-containing protein n=1 Tax=Steroidobacter flavus TaxID=1842136 RepID=A0ABV8SKI1_9GAMM